MRKSNTQPLGEVLREYVKAMNINGKLQEVRLIDSWPDVVGKAIASRTKQLVVKHRVLFVYLNSSVVRNELMYIRADLVRALNERAGESVIDDVVIR